jgi:hypothetical protein
MSQLAQSQKDVPRQLLALALRRDLLRSVTYCVFAAVLAICTWHIGDGAASVDDDGKFSSRSA